MHSTLLCPQKILFSAGKMWFHRSCTYTVKLENVLYDVDITLIYRTRRMFECTILVGAGSYMSRMFTSRSWIQCIHFPNGTGLWNTITFCNNVHRTRYTSGGKHWSQLQLSVNLTIQTRSVIQSFLVLKLVHIYGFKYKSMPVLLTYWLYFNLWGKKFAHKTP